MNTLWRKITIMFRDAGLRRRIFFIFGMLIVFRLLSAIPVPGVDTIALNNFLSGNQFFGLLNIFSGGALSQLSIVMLGVGPYITGSIIMQLLTVMSLRLKDMYHHEGDAGRKRFTQISRYITVPIAMIQGASLLLLLTQQGVLTQLGWVGLISNTLIITAGALLITWIGEMMTEFGISNGVSIIIFAGIVAVIPQSIAQLIVTFDVSQIPVYIGFLVAAVLLIAGIVAINEAERPVPVTYAKQSRGGTTYGGTSTYIPLRINMAGVMPIIFAISILLFPQMIANFLVLSSNTSIAGIGLAINRFLAIGWAYSLLYFALVVVFTYFYTAITFDPGQMASNLQKNGAFVPGVRPGKTTQDYIANIVNRITLVGALFLGVIAVIPVILQSVTGVASFAIGGTSLLIVVSVVIDVIKKVDGQVSMREY